MSNDEGRALEEGCWFAVPDDTKTPYGYDRAWHVWDKDGDSDLKSFWIHSQEDADALIRLLNQVKADLPKDDETDFEKCQPKVCARCATAGCYPIKCGGWPVKPL